MPGDYTRFTFAPGEDHIGVLMQQGRVLLDADFNELVELLERRIRAGTLDTFGRCVVPRTTPDGFEIALAGGMLTIGRGRIYVDGILAENHGLPTPPPAAFDPVLAETVGMDTIRYDEQPYFPDPPALPQGGGPHLVYVDVWQREITYLEEPDLLEKAVGVDSATRLQTVWQVKVLEDVGAGVTCATPADQIPKWVALNAAPAGRLTVRAIGVPAETDPCVVSPTGGFRGTENRLYRVEVHEGGAPGTATFKWSRDNASIAASVLGIDAARLRLTVSRTARDAVLRFSPEDWVEVIDDRLELAGLPGELRKVAVVDDAAGVIELATALPAGTFDANDATRHTRVRRWDQKGLVRDAANNVVANVDASGGAIPVPAAGNLVLEDGIQVEFAVSPAGGEFRTGDSWVFAARTVDATVEELTQAPPRGIHHHYCRLAVYTPTAAGQPSDCRVFWPPEVEHDGGCDCTACVTVEEHNSGTFTIQMAIDQVKNAEGGKVCLGPGVFVLTEPLRIVGAQSVSLEGRGWRTILFFPAGEGDQGAAAIEIASSIGVEVSSLSVFALGIGGGVVLAIAAQNVAALTVQRCLLVQFSTGDAGGAAVGLSGLLIDTAFRENLMFGTIGIATLARFQRFGLEVLERAATSYAYTLGLFLEDNQILGTRGGVILTGVTVHLGDTRVAGNSLYYALQAAIVTEGLVAPWARVDIVNNEIVAGGTGIAFGTDNTRAAWNDVGEFPGRREANTAADGILMVEPLDDREIDHAQLIGNRIIGLDGAGIRIAARIGSAMVKQNTIRETGAGGIVMDLESEAGVLAIENNHLLDLGAPVEERGLAAIRLVRVRQGEIATNIVTGFARESLDIPLVSGIEVIACDSVRLSGNQLSDIGPEEEFPHVAAGIVQYGDFDRFDVVDNHVRRSLAARDQTDSSRWTALWVAGVSAKALVGELGEFPHLETTIFGSDILILDDVAAESGTYAALFGNRLAILVAGRGHAGIRGNVLEARGSLPTVGVMAGRNCVFSENRCLYQPAQAERPVPIALVGASTVIANANYLARPFDDRRPPGLALLVEPRRCTVVANIVESGTILVSGAALGAPWAPLNVLI
jgi:hypothetical protein